MELRKRARVFVVQEPTKFDADTGGYERKIDIAPAMEHGELVFLLPPGKLPFDMREAVKQARAKLRDFGDHDYLLLTGHPVMIGVATHFAAEVNDGRIRFLRWHARGHCYHVVQLNMQKETKGAMLEERPRILANDPRY